MRDPQSIAANEDTRLIPVWSIVLAIVAFALLEYYFWLVLPQQQHHPPPLGFHIYFSLSGGVLVALYFLMVGYISKDAPRRSMSSRFWMLICFVMARCFTSCCVSLRSRVARPAPRMCRATSTSARSAITGLPPTAATATARCAPLTSFVPAAVMSWRATTCLRGCGYWATRSLTG